MINLPPHWSWVKLGDVSKKIHYGYTASAENKNVGPKLLRITDIQEGKVNWNEVPYCTIPSDDIHKYLLSENDIVFARTGATVGKSFLIKGKIPSSVFASYLIRLQLSDKTLPNFIYLFFQSNHYWSQIKSSSAGIGQPNVNAQKLSNLKLPLPPLPEQKKIVEKIEELFSGLDNGVASLKKAKEQIRLYRQSVLASAFSGKLTPSAQRQAHSELPEGWKWKTLKEITSVLGDGLHGTPKYSEDGEYYFINGNNLSDGKVEIKASTKRVTLEEYEKYRKPLNDRTIFVSINGTLGKTAFYNNEKVILGKSACYFNLLEDINKKYIRYYLTSEQFIRYANRTATGSTIKNVSLKAMREFEFPLPSKLQEQTQIVEEIEKRFSEADNLEKAIDESLAKSETLRQSILKQAFEGNLV